MKANELMIGDWVLEKSVDYVDGVIKYVEEKRNVTTNILHQLYNQETGILGKDNLYSIQVEPIPLIAEILNKNGFETNGNGIMAAYCPEDKHANLEISEHYCFDNEKTEGGFYWTINCCEYDIIRLRYVHELQHALKLCGIEKEIQL